MKIANRKIEISKLNKNPKPNLKIRAKVGDVTSRVLSRHCKLQLYMQLIQVQVL